MNSVEPFAANHLRQSTLFAAAAGLLTLALRRNRAHAGKLGHSAYLYETTTHRAITFFPILYTGFTGLVSPRNAWRAGAGRQNPGTPNEPNPNNGQLFGNADTFSVPPASHRCREVAGKTFWNYQQVGGQ
jgi:hypothetical protein